MKYLFTADLHLTHREYDKYRWEIFSWLKRQGENRGVDGFFILGDLTNEKDQHNSKFVNRLIDELKELSLLAPVFILKGNHDYYDPECPFFKFLNGISRIHYYTNVEQVSIHGKKFLMLPHTVAYIKDWKRVTFEGQDFILFHQAIKGAVASTGRKMDQGVLPGVFDRVEGYVIGGDIHVPQVIQQAVYCGAPYPIYFGDNYDPRVLFFDGEKLKSIPRHTISKKLLEITHLDDFKNYDLSEGDQVKVSVKLSRSEFGEWKEYKKAILDLCEKSGLVVCGIDLRELKQRERLRLDDKSNHIINEEQILSGYCKAAKVEKSVQAVGKSILEGIRGNGS